MRETTNLVGAGEETSSVILKRWFFGPNGQKQRLGLHKFEDEYQEAMLANGQVLEKETAVSSTAHVEVLPQ
jgi:hypothetical protein